MPAAPESPLTELTHIALSLDALNCGAMLVGRNGIIAHVNPRLCEQLHRRREDLVGSSLRELYGVGERVEAGRNILQDFEQSREMEFFLPLPGGQRLPVVLSARPVGSGSVLAEYSVVTLIDISRQKAAEQRLIEQNQRISQLSDQVRLQADSLKEYAESLEQRVQRRTMQLHDAHQETIYMLAIASEAKDEDTARHIRRIRQTTHELAIAMGINPAESERLAWSAVLHDVGKMHTPDQILKKPGPLNATERARMEEHTLAGERILKPSHYFSQASQIARSHHENWDGSGYPDHLIGEKIPLEARIVHIADVYDALIHARVYKTAWSHADAQAEILSQRGKMFDPAVVDAFEKIKTPLAEPVLTKPSEP